MADEFDLFLRKALAPPARGPDRPFVARVETLVVLEERLQAERRNVLHQLGLAGDRPVGTAGRIYAAEPDRRNASGRARGGAALTASAGAREADTGQ